MESINENNNNINNINNKLSKTPKRIKIKKKILEFPKYMTNEELRYRKKKLNKNLIGIEKTHKYIQDHNIFEEVKGDTVYKYIQELKILNKKEENEENNKKLIKKNKEKEKNKKFLVSINRKILENSNKKTPSNIFDFVHPYEYYFTHRRIKASNNSEINNNQSLSRYLVLKPKNFKNKKISKLYMNNNTFNNSEKKFKNEIFLTLYKKNPNKIPDKIQFNNSSKILFNKKNENNSKQKYINNFFTNNNDNNLIHLKNNLSKNDDEKNSNVVEQNINNKSLNFNNKNDDTMSNNNIYYNTESIHTKKVNFLEKNNFNSSFKLVKNNLNNKSSNLSELQKESQLLINNNKIKTNYNNIILTRNYFSKKPKIFNNKKKYYLSTENNINKDSFNLNYSSNKNRREKGRRVISIETSLSKKRKKNELFQEITNIDEQLNNIKNDIISNRKFDNEDIYKKFEEIKKRTKEDMIVSNILAEKGRAQMQSTKELFKKMKQKSFISDLTKQYFTCKKGKYENSIKQKFLKELKKVDLLEKKDALLRDLAYKKNYEIRKGVNKLRENDLFKERKIFNKKTDRMKQININNIENFIKSMNKH